MSENESGAIQTSLGELRHKRGLSAIQLAAEVGVSRQTIYAIEAGTYIPNTAVALRLARSLDAAVEELFSLADGVPPPRLRPESVTLLPGSSGLQAGQPVQLCRVEKRLMASSPSPVQWCFPVADAVVAEKPGRKEKTSVQVFNTEGNFDNRILVAGCDPGISVLSRHIQLTGVELVVAHRNSSQALSLLNEGCVHIAGTHLRDEVSGESNLPEIGRLFTRNSVAVISFAVWEEGIVTAAGNPKRVQGIEDLAHKNIRIVNREVGAGSRVLLDYRLKKLGMKPNQVRGYDSAGSGHLSVAWQVQTGAADACIATSAAARIFGLNFIPLVSERYDLVIRKQHLDLPRIQNLLDTLCRADFRRELEGLGGYDTRVTGERLL